MDLICENLKQRIRNPNAVFVFPSEVAAAFWRKEILLNIDSGAVSSTRFISWDRFKEEAFLLSGTDIPANNITRTVFISSEVDEHRKTPLYPHLLPPQYPESFTGLRKDLQRMLPELRALVDATQIKSWPVCSDVRLLYARYLEFLERYGIFEPGYLDPVLGDLTKEYTVFLPELIEDFDIFAGAVEASSAIDTVSMEACSLPPLYEFTSQKNEIRSLFQEIRRVLKSGTGIDEIAVTVPGIDTVEEEIRYFSRIYGVPVTVRSGMSLSSYAGNRLWQLILECTSSCFSFSSMKNMLCNRGIPFREREAYIDLTRALTLTSSTGNWYSRGAVVDFIGGQLEACGYLEEKKRYLDLVHGMNSLVSASGFAQLRSAVHRFIHIHLNTGLWDGSVQLKAFQAGLDLLNDFCDSEERFSEFTIPNPLSIWLEALESKRYVDKESSGGVSIYPYRVSAGIRPAYHYIINASASALEIVHKHFSVLSDQQRSELEGCSTDLTESFIKAYCGSGQKVIFSCSRNGYAGPGLPPSLFMEQGLVVPVKNESSVQKADPCIMERHIWETGTFSGDVLLWQKESAALSFPALTVKKEHDMARDPLGYGAVPLPAASDGRIEISPTALDSYRTCGFRYCADRLLKLDPDFHRLLVTDPRVIGELEHRILKRFMEEAAGSGGIYTYVPEHEALMADITGEILTKGRSRRAAPLPPEQNRVAVQIAELLSGFPEVEGKTFGGYFYGGGELSFSFEIQNGVSAVASGRIDRISRSPEGGLFVIDYKKKNRRTAKDYRDSGDGFPKSLQLIFYTLLLEETGHTVDGAAYYSVEDQKYDIVFSDLHKKVRIDTETLAGLKNLLKDRLPGYVRTLEEGAFPVTADEDNCAGCSFRPVCRERYAVRSV